MKRLKLDSLIDLKMIENMDFSTSLKDSGYPNDKYQKELQRNLSINLNKTKLKFFDDYMIIKIIFNTPDDVSIGGLEYFDTLQI